MRATAPSKLSRYADGVMEAAWLAALIVVPVFFNIYSSRIFEPDKLALLRTLALVILGAWIVKLVEQGGPGGEHARPGSWWRGLLRVPLMAPVLGLALVYLIATAFSIAPRISFWGSYQRLQGTYTTLSYLVLFAALAANLRKRAQVERLITTAILASLPVSLYGVLQRYQIDPVPWGGNVTRRIAANMGNSIFVAAYLVMVSPLTLGRIVAAFGAILNEARGLSAHFVRATVYVFIAALQLIALYMSGSRGPMLGWLAGAFFLFVLLSLHWCKRWLTLGIVGSAAALAGFLVLLNVPNGPLEALRTNQGVGHLGRAFEVERGTGRVRALIWEGAARLVAPHPPLEYPDGSVDRFNLLRPIIGYGPESMHMAFNPFFPPELAHLERRNASPDRSHNETWDALVTTGILGLLVYLSLFVSIFYFGLKWLGLIASAGQRRLFLALLIGGGVLGAIGLVLWQGVGFFGVGLPFGMVIGLIVYLTWVSLAAGYEPPETEGGRARALTLIALLSLVVAHFVEIHFGIAIAATRTYFWASVGCLLVVGFLLPLTGEYGSALAEKVVDRQAGMREAGPAESKGGRKKHRRAVRGRVGAASPGEMRPALTGGVVTAVILVTLGYDFINLQLGAPSVSGVIWASFTRLPNQNGALSYGILSMLLTVWLAGGLLFPAEGNEGEELDWRKPALTLAVSGGLALLFWLWHAGWLVAMARSAAANQLSVTGQAVLLEGLLTRYYVYVLALILLAGRYLPEEWPVRWTRATGAGAVAAPAVLTLVLALAYFANLRPIHADVAYKLAEPFSRNRQWQQAIEVYQRATRLAPAEDFYYLFLGKAYLDFAQTAQDPAQEAELVGQAEHTLQRAQELNPLNTDHTANLARLYRWWASRATEPEARRERALASSGYYARAVALSPNNVGLWGEWASLYLTLLDQPDEAHRRLAHALEVDPEYDPTHALLGDYYNRLGRESPDERARREALELAARHYASAIDLTRPNALSEKLNYRLVLGGVFVELGELQNAIQVFEEAVQQAPGGAEVWRIQETIASLYIQAGDRSSALVHATSALAGAPNTEKARLQALISNIQSGP